MAYMIQVELVLIFSIYTCLQSNLLNLMITPQIVELLRQLRESEKKSQGSKFQLGHITEEQYSDCVATIAQEAQRLEFSRSTAFLAKKYFEIFLAKTEFFDSEDLVLVMICCLRCAVKFNESSHIANQYNIEFCMVQSEWKYSEEMFSQCEIELVKALDFKLKYTTPYDYSTFLVDVPKEDELENPQELPFYELANEMIVLYLTFLESASYSSQSIFFGCWLYCSKAKNRQTLTQVIIGLPIQGLQQDIHEIVSFMNEYIGGPIF